MEYVTQSTNHTQGGKVTIFLKLEFHFFSEIETNVFTACPSVRTTLFLRKNKKIDETFFFGYLFRSIVAAAACDEEIRNSY